jgi:hypothetical protein
MSEGSEVKKRNFAKIVKLDSCFAKFINTYDL